MALQAGLQKPDQILPHFVTNVLPSPLPGLVIAGILAATMSTLSSGLNSLCTVTMVDFYRRFRQQRGSDSGGNEDVKTARWFTLGWGIGITFTAMFMGALGQIVEGTLKVLGFLSGPLLGMFLLGILTRRANTVGVLAGAVAGTLVTYLVARTNVAWLWYGPVGCLATVAVGYPFSFLRPAISLDRVMPLTVWGRPSAAAAEPAPE